MFSLLILSLTAENPGKPVRPDTLHKVADKLIRNDDTVSQFVLRHSKAGCHRRVLTMTERGFGNVEREKHSTSCVRRIFRRNRKYRTRCCYQWRINIGPYCG